MEELDFRYLEASIHWFYLQRKLFRSWFITTIWYSPTLGKFITTA